MKDQIYMDESQFQCAFKEKKLSPRKFLEPSYEGLVLACFLVSLCDVQMYFLGTSGNLLATHGHTLN